MGIAGLLPLLKSIQRPTELKNFAGQTLGVDAYGWLHRGAVSCAIDLAQGKITRKYVDFAMHRVRMCKYFGVTPYLVFDGDNLPSKKATEDSRAKRRDDSRKSGMELLKAGKPSQAQAELQKAIDVTPEMARHLIEELKKASVPYVVAPYEADAQMVYLERQGLISGIISEDSDLLVFGAKRLLTKLDQHGQCVEVNRRDFSACREISLTGWTDAEFRQMAILSGCDYLDSISNMGLKTAYRMMRKHKTPEKAIRMLQFDGKFRVPSDYLALFRQAEMTFIYQRVYCPETQQQVFLTPPTADVNVDELPFIGAFVEPELARSIAIGDVNPITKEKIRLAPLPEARKRPAPPPPRNSQSGSSSTPVRKPIDSYFKGDRRIPLGSMDPNCFNIDKERVATLTENGQRPIVYPLPRPYVDETANQPLQRSRSYIPQSPAPGPSRLLRRRTEPVSNLLQDHGMSLGSTSRRQTLGPLSERREPKESGNLMPSAPPTKKARLCDEASSDSVPGKERSKFFPAGSKAPAAPKNTSGYLMSDDSIEQAMSELPDIDGWHRPSKAKKDIVVFDEGLQHEAEADSMERMKGLPDVDGWHRSSKSKKDVLVFDERSQDTTECVSKDDDHEDANPRTGSTTSAKEAKTSETPVNTGSLSHFSFTQTSTSTSLGRLRNSRSRATPASSTQSSVRSTPASSESLLATSSTARSTPATPRSSCLQLIGNRALNRHKQPSTPSASAPRPAKRRGSARSSLGSVPVNASSVPLPPMDLEEVEALHKPVGSEDMLAPESEVEDTGTDLEEQENVEERGGESTVKKMDLSKFMCT